MIATTINGSNDYHNVLIVGYTVDKKYIYADTAVGGLCVASKDHFSNYYMYIITGIKNIK